MDELEGLVGGGLDELDIFSVDEMDELVGDGREGVGAAEETEGPSAIAGLFEELAFAGFYRGLAGIDSSAGAA